MSDRWAHTLGCQYRYWYIALAIILLGFLIHLGYPPLFLEEPRRALIAWEMVYRNDFILPTEFSTPYYRKPPLYNWVLAVLGQWTDWSRFALRLPSVLAVLAMGGMTVWVVRRHSGAQVAHLAGMLTLVTAGWYFYFSLLAEIDLLYAALLYAALLVLYHQEQREQPVRLFVGYYTLLSLAVLTKGIPQVSVVGGLSLLGWLWYQRRLRWLWHPGHLSGIATGLLLVGGYFLALAQKVNDWQRYWSDQFGDSTERTLLKQPLNALAQHVVQYPLDIMVDLLPGSILLVLLLFRSVRRHLRARPLLAFCALMVLVNLPLYWISPGAKPRYVYMLYPMMLILGSHAWHAQAPVWPRLANMLHWVAIGALILIGMGGIALPFVEQIQVGLVIPLLVSASAFFFALRLKKDTAESWPALFIALGLARILFDVAVLPLRASTGEAPLHQARAEQIYALAADHPIVILGTREVDRISHATAWHLTQLRQRPLSRVNKPAGITLFSDVYLIAHPDSLAVLPETNLSSPVLEWTYGDMKRVLVLLH